MNLIGRPPIHPFVFYTGKVAGYFTWAIFVFSILKVISIGKSIFSFEITSYVLSGIGSILVIISLANLGASTRLGIPDEKTRLKTEGIYQLSRNPMYLGFNLWTLSSILFTGNIFILILGAYSIVVYDFIISGEEKFLENRFQKQFLEYKRKVRRYL